MEMKLDKNALGELGRGVLSEMFQRELETVLNNIADVNTETKKKREITLKVTFVPTQERDAVAVSMEAASKLASVHPATTRLLLAQEGRKQVAYEERLQERLLIKDGAPMMERVK